MNLEILEGIVADVAEEFHHKYIGGETGNEDAIAIAVEYTSFIINMFIDRINSAAAEELNDNS